MLVSFFIKGKNQEEGSSAINVEEHEEFEVLVSLISNNAPHFQQAFNICVTLYSWCDSDNNLERQAEQVGPASFYRDRADSEFVTHCILIMLVGGKIGARPMCSYFKFSVFLMSSLAWFWRPPWAIIPRRKKWEHKFNSEIFYLFFPLIWYGGGENLIPSFLEAVTVSQVDIYLLGFQFIKTVLKSLWGNCEGMSLL